MRIPLAALASLVLLAVPAWSEPADDDAAGLLPPQVGDAMPALDVDGDRLDFDDGGGVTYVEFWATWCPPCVARFDHLNDLAAEFADGGVTFVHVALDDDPETAEAYLADRPLAGRHAFDPGWRASRPALDVGSIPHAVLVGPDGTILARGTPDAAQDADAIRAALAGERPAWGQERWVGGGTMRRFLAFRRAMEPLLRAGPTGFYPMFGELPGDVGAEQGGADPLFRVELRPSLVKPDGGFAGMSAGLGGRYVGVGVTAEHLARDAYPDLVDVGDARLPDGLYDAAVFAPFSDPAEGEPLLQRAVTAYFNLDARAEVREVDALAVTATPAARLLDPALDPREEGGTTDDGSERLANLHVARVPHWLGTVTDLPILDETGLPAGAQIDGELVFHDLDSLRTALAEVGLEVVEVRRRVPVTVLTARPDPDYPPPFGRPAVLRRDAPATRPAG